MLRGECSVECFKYNSDKRATFRAFNLFKGLNVVVFGAVHDRENLSGKLAFFSRPLT